MVREPALGFWCRVFSVSDPALCRRHPPVFERHPLMNTETTSYDYGTPQTEPEPKRPSKLWLLGLSVLAAVAVAAGACTVSDDASAAASSVDNATADPAPSTTAAPPSTTTAPTTTTTPGPVWDWDESYLFNEQNLIGAPIDPLLAADVDAIDRELQFSAVDERYWASYIAVADITCKSLEALWDLGVEENWNTGVATLMLNAWLEDMAIAVNERPGFASMNREEVNELIVAGVDANGCRWILEAFFDFID